MNKTRKNGKLEWVDAENASLELMCTIDQFTWGQRLMWEKGPDHGKFNFIRLLDSDIDENRFGQIINEQEAFFQQHSKTLNIKISDSIFPAEPTFLNHYKIVGSPLVSILIRHDLLPEPGPQPSISIRECETVRDIESFIEVNASGREWALDNPIYQAFRQPFTKGRSDASYYVLCVNDKPACTARINYFADKYNFGLLATHKDFQRRGLMNYINQWLAQQINKDFYVQVNDDEPSYSYYSQLNGSEIINTEFKYVKK